MLIHIFKVSSEGFKNFKEVSRTFHTNFTTVYTFSKSYQKFSVLNNTQKPRKIQIAYREGRPIRGKDILPYCVEQGVKTSQ